ncbi:hypothetical protein F5888DRAFT_1809420 [Russula emetica]|nr:hypothetical protein F5888DRAFT_1809420 [Russula emetica]
MAAKTVLRFMSLETGGVHPLATEPDIQLNTDLSVNLLDIRVDVIGGDQIVLVLVDLRIHNPESDAIYLAHRAPNMTYEDVLAVLSKDLVLFLKRDIPCLELCRVTTSRRRAGRAAARDAKPPAAQNKAWATWQAAGVSTNTSGSLIWSLTLEVSLRIPHIGNVLANILRRTKLTSFSLMPLAPLPDDIPCLLSPQMDLDRFVFMAPSVLTSSRTGKAVDDFFRRIGALGSGMMNMPNSTRSCDSGMFSGEGIDFTKIKKSTKKLKKRSVEERAPIIGAFV